MYMASNQPLNRADSVFDGAAMGAAIGAGSVAALRHGGASKLQDLNSNNYVKNQASASSAFNKLKEIGEKGEQKAIQASAKTPGAVNIDDDSVTKAARTGRRQAMQDSEAYGDYKNAKRKMQMNERVDRGLGAVQKASGKKRAMLYAGSVIAGALGGAMIDNRGY